jgi:hypothetical protein
MKEQYDVFALYTNFKDIFEKDIDKSIYHGVRKKLYLNQKDFVKNTCVYISNLWIQGQIKENDILNYFTLMYLENGKISWTNIRSMDIVECKKLTTKSRIESDKKFLDEVNEKFGVSGYSKYFRINSNGFNLMYELIQKNHISPFTYLILYENCDSGKYEKSNKQTQFDTRINTIKRKTMR